MNINKEKQKLNVLIPLHTILIQIFFFPSKTKNLQQRAIYRGCKKYVQEQRNWEKKSKIEVAKNE